MNELLAYLTADGFNLSDITPDGKFHRFASDATDELNMAWYVAYQNFSNKDGAPYHTIVYGDWKVGIPPRSFTTLIDGNLADKAIVKKRIRSAEKLYNENYDAVKNTLPINFNELSRAEIAQAELTELRAEKALNDKLNNTPKPEGMKISALGFKEKEYFFTSSENKQIVSMSKFSTAEFMNLAPIEYWAAVFPGGGAARVDWSQATSDLMKQARERGIFQQRHVRGAGVWKDENRVVVNMGDHLVVDGVRVELGSLESRYFYTLGSSLRELHSSPLSLRECDTLVEACSTFKWLKSDYSFIIAGALVTARICGALPVRPHVWITGGAHTGKSTLLEKLVRTIHGDSSLYFYGATSEAGIRQSLKTDAVPILFDEFETTGQGSGERVSAVVELLRAAWSESSAMLVKGGATGNATAYQVRCSAIVSSIRTRLTNDADRQRFAVIELAPHGSDAEHWIKLQDLLSQIDEEYAERLFARTIKMVPTLLANYKAIKRVLSKKVGSRFGDQYGMLLAGYSVLLSDDVMTEQQCESLCSTVQLSDEREEAKVTDHEDALICMLTKKIQLEKQGTKYDFGLGEAINAAQADIEIREALQRIGIKVESEFVAVASKHTELESLVFKGTRWSQTWSGSLSRVPGALKNQSVWISGRNQKATRIPVLTFKS